MSNATCEPTRAQNLRPSPVLDQPPVSLIQVLEWAEDLHLYPTTAEWSRARALPPTTTLAQILTHLGADLQGG